MRRAARAEAQRLGVFRGPQGDHLVSLRAFPGGFHKGDQELDQFFVVKADGYKALVSDVFGLVQQFQPVKGFVGFFEGNVHFVSEIGFAFGMFCFLYRTF